VLIHYMLKAVRLSELVGCEARGEIVLAENDNSFCTDASVRDPASPSGKYRLRSVSNVKKLVLSSPQLWWHFSPFLCR